MPSDVWNLDDRRAHLSFAELAAQVTIANSGLGLHDLLVRRQPMIGAYLFATQFAASASPPVQVVSDCFVRGRDLVATYAQREELPVRLQIYWRALSEADVPGCLAGIDVQVSVQTSLLAAVPALVIHSRLPAQSVAHLAEGAPQPQRAGAGEMRRPARGCWLWRLPAVNCTYAEMAHPADVERDEVVSADANGAEIAHHLFAQTLEKGVILRARARGIFVAADGDVATIAAAHARFLEAPLPLTT